MAPQINRVLEFEARLKECNARIGEIKKETLEKAERHFDESGGCTSCRGRGWVVTWDTMDSMTGCYHESAGCSAEGCTEETRKISGLSTQNNKYDNFHGSRWNPQYSSEEQGEIRSIQDEIGKLNYAISIESDKWSVTKGKVCKVARPSKGPKARRVPVGIVGYVKHIHTNSWGGSKCILVDDKGQQWWPKVEQVDVIDPNPDMKVWNKLDEEDREKSGFPVVVTVKRKSAKAALIKTTRGTEFWIPLSQVPELKKFRQGSVAAISMPMWLAKKNGLCGDKS